MGVSVPHCDPKDQEKYNCPSKTQINSWRKNGLLSKVHYFWGHNNLPLPSNTLDDETMFEHAVHVEMCAGDVLFFMGGAGAAQTIACASISLR